MKNQSSRSLPFILLLLVMAFPALLGAQNQAEHILTASDTIEVKVYQEPDLDAKGTISKDGKVVLPLIGQVSVAGLTTDGAARLIAVKYQDGYLVKPNVTVAVAQYARLRFTILGEVTRPNSYYFPEGEKQITLLQAIGLSGGYTRGANQSKITIKRGNTIIKVDGSKLSDEGASAYPVLPGDVVTVGRSFL
ncbi:MAG: polysaccharide export protein [Verrucomicrobiaceae bacterium]|nr:MAG: polysaccharide export protein [Verrucomicrobiaceae bacterium]